MEEGLGTRRTVIIAQTPIPHPAPPEPPTAYTSAGLRSVEKGSSSLTGRGLAFVQGEPPAQFGKIPAPPLLLPDPPSAGDQRCAPVVAGSARTASCPWRLLDSAEDTKGAERLGERKETRHPTPTAARAPAAQSQ
jgi:hypothetical protein